MATLRARYTCPPPGSTFTIPITLAVLDKRTHVPTDPEQLGLTNTHLTSHVWVTKAANSF